MPFINLVATALAWPWAALNSNISTAFFASVAGAAGGAWAVQKTVERSEIRKELLEQIRSANAAITVTVALVNSFASLKRQYVFEINSDLENLNGRWIAYLKRLSENPEADKEAFKFDTTLEISTFKTFGLEELKNIMFGRMNAEPAMLSLYQLIAQASANTIDMIEQRNAIINDIRKDKNFSPEDVVHLYLGLRRSDGNIDHRHPHLVQGIKVQVNDVIVFGCALAEKLALYSEKTCEKYGEKSPEPLKPDFAKLDDLDLYPALAEYTEILSHICR